jgi:FIMAH domain
MKKFTLFYLTLLPLQKRPSALSVNSVGYPRRGSVSARVLPLLALLFLLGFASTARAQITFDAAASGSGSGTTVSWSHTVGAGSNRILVVGLSITVPNPSPPADSVTYGGQSLTRQVLNGGATPISEIWTLVGPLTGTAQVVVTHSEAGGQIVGGSVSFSGVDQATPIRARSQARASSVTSVMVSTNVTSSTGDVVIDAVALTGPSPSGTPAAGQTARWSGSLDGVTFGAGSTKPGESGSTTMTWNLSVQIASPALGALGAISLRPVQNNTPGQMIEELIETVQSFELHHGIENALLAKLNAALRKLANGNTEGARGSLGAFINQVEAQSGKKITVEQADELIAAANAILAALE